MQRPKPPLLKSLKIISGGQTGADRAALDWAIKGRRPHGGWCPKGRWAEDGPISERYLLQETPSSNPAQRTEWNVRDSDGTAILSVASTLSGGSRLTAKFARDYGKPWLHLHSLVPAPALALSQFVRQHKIKVLNVAGPRASQAPPIGKFVRAILEQAFNFSVYL
jgi:hypothetical protein